MTRTLLVLITLVVIGHGNSRPVMAQSGVVPELVNYQGLLADLSGEPFPSGSYILEVNVWDAPTGGTLLWGPQVFDLSMGDTPMTGHALRVPVAAGRFNVMLGPEDLGGALLSDALTSASVFIELTVPERGGVIQPRQRLLATPYALQAENLGGRVSVDGVAAEVAVEGDLVVASGGDELLRTEDGAQLVTVDGDLTVTGQVQGDLDVAGSVLASNLVGTSGDGLGLVMRSGVAVVTYDVPGPDDRTRSITVDLGSPAFTEVVSVFVSTGHCTRTCESDGRVEECGGDYRRAWTRASVADVAADNEIRIRAGIEDTGFGAACPPFDPGHYVRRLDVHWMVLGR
ncbi:MAG: hypothetical protein AAF533_08940 [Acidobacteriota bacterium]